MKKLVISLILGMAPVLAGAAGMADFSQCRQFFAHSAPPKVTATSD
jgi:endonuclease G